MEDYERCVYRAIDKGLDAYISSLEFNEPPCYDHLEYAVSVAADIDVIEYILKQGVPPGNVLTYFIFSPEDDWGFGTHPLNFEFEDEIVILLFEYGAGYDSYMLNYLNEESKERFFDLERRVFISNIKG